MSEREALFTNALALADEIDAAEKEMIESGWGGYIWEHLGDANKDIHALIRGLREADKIRDERDALREALQEWSALGDLPGGGYGGTLRSRTAAALAAGGSDD